MDRPLKMNKYWFILLIPIIQSGLLNAADSDPFGKPPFLEGPKDDRIEFIKNSGDENLQQIRFEEEISETITIAYVNYEKKDPPPKIGTFIVGTNALLGADLEYDETVKKWALIIKKKQDYEEPNMRKYDFNIYIEDIDNPRSVLIEIINIPDNQPIINADQKKCEVEETELGVGNTGCTYSVTDLDELLYDQPLKFQLDGETADKFFEIKAKIEDKRNAKISLNVKKALNYDEAVIHLLTFLAINAGDLTGSLLDPIKVINVPSRPPKWQNIFSSKTFDEKSEQFFTVLAKDGDVEINTEINYRIELEDEDEAFFEILDKTKGEIHVKPIDRDALQKDVFYFTIIAYKKNDETSKCDQRILIMLNDLNDNKPEITLPKDYQKLIYIDEETFVEFDKAIVVDDIDTPKFATYNIELKDKDGEVGWNKAFALKPTHGYQETELQLYIMDASLLDFDIPEWQNITLEIIATETADNKHIDRASIEIRLINLNDEIPIFNPSDIFEVEHKENIKKGTTIVTLKATDRDIGDSLIYSLSTSAQRSFTIDELTGEIKTKLDKSLDYEQQTEVSLQVYVEDTLVDKYERRNKVQGEVIIKVIDINDKTPQITLDSSKNEIEIVENTPENTEVEGLIIRAFDPDTTAQLKFQIDWKDSWAVKQGRNAPLEIFENCLRIEWKEDGSNNDAVAKLIVQKPKPDVDETIDYEMYETLYVSVTVVDLKQAENKDRDTVVIPIYIIDVNDNAPEFNLIVTDQNKFVRDKAEKDTLIGTVLATDADGPDFNFVTYALIPLNGIPENLVAISEEQGELRVSGKIDCDSPNYWPSLNYTVSATDCINRDGETIEPCFTTKHDITITINDQNNQKPEVIAFSNGTDVKIYENEASGFLINEIDAFDKDRDVPYYTIWYAIDSPPTSEISEIFDVTEDGMFYVNCKNGEKSCLDRDHGEFLYDITVKMYDNHEGKGDGIINQNKAEFKIELLDINDNAPIFDEPSDFKLKSVKENAKIGARIDKIHAYDLDDPNLDNSKVVYGIAHTYKVNDKTSKDYADLFEIETEENFLDGYVNVKKSLKDHFGTFILTLTVHDKGIPQLSSSQNFSLEILKYNYQEPKILYPTNDLALQKPLDETQLNDLFQYNGSPLPLFEADDGYRGEKWEIVFSIEPDDIFALDPIATNKAKLKLLKMPPDGSYSCLLMAIDNGDPSKSSKSTFKTYFITDGQPIFDPNTGYTEFFEDINGTLQDPWKIPKAMNPNEEVPGIYKPEIYYFIIGGDADRFVLDKKTRELSVNKDKPLDYREIPYHSVLVAATNLDKYPTNPPTESQITITIKVLGINKYKPEFVREIFSSGIHLNTKIDDTILKLMATDLDLPNDTLRYDFNVDSIEVSDPSLEDNKDATFSINEKTGAIVLKRTVQPSMDGYYTFDVTVYDEVDHSDTAKVFVYVIREDKHQVMFAFNNSKKEVEEKQPEVADTFTAAFDNECNIDKILEDVESSGIPIEDRSLVYTHFIKDNIPVDGEIIKSEASDLETMYNLRSEFKMKYDLIFDYAFKETNTQVKDMQQLLQTILIVVVAILATLCMILFAAFIIRTRSLNQRLEALSTTKFGSQDSNLNRIGAPLPNTNQFAVQGSNPVWNDDIRQPEYDVKSVGSGDSALVGIEDSLTFNNFGVPISPEEQRRASFNPVMQQEMKRKSLNPMAHQNLSLDDE